MKFFCCFLSPASYWLRQAVHRFCIIGVVALVFATRGVANEGPVPILRVNALEQLEICDAGPKVVRTIFPGAVGEKVDLLGQVFQVSFGRDARGRLSVIVYPDPSNPRTISVDAFGERVKIGPDGVLTMLPSADGSRAEFRAGLVGSVEVSGKALAAGGRFSNIPERDTLTEAVERGSGAVGTSSQARSRALETSSRSEAVEERTPQRLERESLKALDAGDQRKVAKSPESGARSSQGRMKGQSSNDKEGEGAGGVEGRSTAGPSATDLFYPLNVARMSLVTSMLEFNDTLKQWIPSPALAWLDDDWKTGWKPPVGQSHYLVAFNRVQTIRNFQIMSGQTKGLVSLAISDTIAPPQSHRWRTIFRDVPVSDLNNQKVDSDFEARGQYLMLSLDLESSDEWGVINAFGDANAFNFKLENRDTASSPLSSREEDLAELAEEYSLVPVNVSALYAGARVIGISSMPEGISNSEVFAYAQKILDDDLETVVEFDEADTEPVVVLDLGAVRLLDRSRLSVKPTEGVASIYVFDSFPPKAPSSEDRVVAQGVATGRSMIESSAPLELGADGEVFPVLALSEKMAASPEFGSGVSAQFFRQFKPVAEMEVAASDFMVATDFPATEGRYVVMVWKGSQGSGGPLSIRGFSVLNTGSFAAYRIIDSRPNAERSSDRLSNDIDDPRDLLKASRGPAGPFGSTPLGGLDVNLNPPATTPI